MTSRDTGRLPAQLDGIFRSVFEPPTGTFKNTLSAQDDAVSKETSAAWNLVTESFRLPRTSSQSFAHKSPSRTLDRALSSLLSNDETTNRLVSVK